MQVCVEQCRAASTHGGTWVQRRRRPLVPRVLECLARPTARWTFLSVAIAITDRGRGRRQRRPGWRLVTGSWPRAESRCFVTSRISRSGSAIAARSGTAPASQRQVGRHAAAPSTPEGQCEHERANDANELSHKSNGCAVCLSRLCAVPCPRPFALPRTHAAQFPPATGWVEVELEALGKEVGDLVQDNPGGRFCK